MNSGVYDRFIDPLCPIDAFEHTRIARTCGSAAATFVRALNGLSVDVRVSWEGRTVNGRSMLDLMTLGAPRGSMLEVLVSGTDAQSALEALTKVVENRFYEE